MEDSQRIVLKKIDNWFVVLEPNVMRKLPQTFFHELVLLLLKNVWDIQLLELLVGTVDKKLLQRVDIEDFEAKDIQKSNTFPITVWMLIIIKTHLLDFNFLVHFLD